MRRAAPAKRVLPAFFLCLTVCTIAATAFLFAMDYRIFYARWHAPFGTLTWVYQFVFTSAGAVYQFVVMGIRLYLPVGFACPCSRQPVARTARCLISSVEIAGHLC